MVPDVFHGHSMLLFHGHSILLCIGIPMESITDADLSGFEFTKWVCQVKVVAITYAAAPLRLNLINASSTSAQGNFAHIHRCNCNF